MWCHRLTLRRRRTKKFCSAICKTNYWRGLPKDYPTERELIELDVGAFLADEEL
jgi:hypothetical protein